MIDNQFNPLLPNVPERERLAKILILVLFFEFSSANAIKIYDSYIYYGIKIYVTSKDNNNL